MQITVVTKQGTELSPHIRRWTVRGDYAALLIQNMAKKLTTTDPVPETPKPKPEPEKPVKQPKLWAEIEKLT